ncbi:helix-turn-helix domain protein [Pseudonocardia dioxanivorans CB1190]|uniref:Helix-turn-helix domain protein n=1 Tax=Pseudonocardia dioxanivorans (strain ATCC 55486 / DSM 44775 / JCM 13855 / CB1190) TaxID=675635 RepID=F4CS70_PSEUX|nr:helix-turn-helix transcriptional regulator [Pseudonocardia dioxanivorans]AEA22630.1 helix-turn-helix domain protein [Pseudonocardia dioxanivorans CB1190]
MAEAHGPAGPRRRLGAELRRLRSKAGLHLEDVAREMTCSTSKISRLENGKGIPKLPDVRELMRIYGVTAGTERDMLLRLAREGRQQGWWEPYTEGVQAERFVLDSPGRYPALETEAIAVRLFTGMILPGLLQTAAYAREMLAALLPHHLSAEIDRLVELRMERQRALTRDEAPLQLSAVLDEALLRRVVGGPELMREQLAVVLEKAAMSTVDVRVLAFDAGFHRAHLGQFTVLELREPLDDLVYIEGHGGDSYLESTEDVKLYKEVYADVVSKALPPPASEALIREYLHRYESGEGGL